MKFQVRCLNIQLLICISLILFLIGVMNRHPKITKNSEKELIGEWGDPELGSVKVEYWDEQKTRILINGFTQHGLLQFAGSYTVINDRHLKIRDESIGNPYELHLEWGEGRLDLYAVDETNQTIPPDLQFQFSQFYGNGSFDLPETTSPCGLGKLNVHGQSMVRALARNGTESWEDWVKRLHAIVPELVLSEPASVTNPESYPRDLVDFWKVCGGMDLGMFPIVHSPSRLDESTVVVQPLYSKPIVVVNDVDGWGYCLSKDSSKPFLISWDHEVDFEDSEELLGTLSDIIAERIAEVATVYPPFDLTYNKLFRAEKLNAQANNDLP